MILHNRADLQYVREVFTLWPIDLTIKNGQDFFDIQYDKCTLIIKMKTVFSENYSEESINDMKSEIWVKLSGKQKKYKILYKTISVSLRNFFYFHNN